ncbi:DUF2089 domain-containing protein [Paracholeplasma manati]|jgi:hypothetical protein|uniref:DUF2089 domain-containing protein n=1 Tax=Paracholeplasma manati TaxID=591373 RepID=A0ABT2Y4V8_9MOLU|nr:DUF2089 domain-containing protein [Paracholeplasma manati]MCV2231775.1 DUF2089 domain-containing protein [Paracholeplasma manati]MDG0889303.1 DUF2089 domain-containing protein [Paracholeplasma manati]
MRDITKAFELIGADLVVTEIQSKKKDITVRGEFQLSKFDYLTKEQQYFIEVFIKNQGNIKQIEKELGISYPTVKKSLEEVTQALGYKVEDSKDDEKRIEIFERIRKGELTIEEAEAQLKKLK